MKLIKIVVIVENVELSNHVDLINYVALIKNHAPFEIYRDVNSKILIAGWTIPEFPTVWITLL